MDTITIALDQIQIPPRKRPLDPDAVQALAASMERVGLLNPLTVTVDHTLVAGRHRLEAARSLNWGEIRAVVMTGDDLDTELAEIDENLIRHELSALERVEHLARRDELIRARGQRAPSHRPNKGADSAPLLTTAELAGQVGLSERRAQEYLQIANGLPSEVRDQIRHTRVAQSASELLQLAQVTNRKQQANIAAYLAEHPDALVYNARSIVENRFRPCETCGAAVDGFIYGCRHVIHCAGCDAHFPANTIMCGHCGHPIPNGTALYDHKDTFVRFYYATTDDDDDDDDGADQGGPPHPSRRAPPVAAPTWEVPALTFRDFPGTTGEDFRAAWRLFSQDPADLRLLLPDGVKAELGMFLATAQHWVGGFR